MSRDARNSLIAWSSVLALFALFWLALRYDLPVTPEWLRWINLVLLLAVLVWEIMRQVRKRRRQKAGG